MNEYPYRPDITIACHQCNCYVDLQALGSHRAYHRSLEIMQYIGDERPDSVSSLLKRRQAILRKMKKSTTANSPLEQHDLQRLNDAYECLKSDLEDTFQAYRDLSENILIDVHGVALNCSAPCALAVGLASDANKRWKSQMEDTRVFQDCFGNDPNKCFFAIYDGHHGKYASEVAANVLHHALLVEMEKFDPKTKCTCTFNMADSYDISQYEIHSRPNTASTIRGKIHETSTNIIHQIISTCEDRVSELCEEDRKTLSGDVKKGEHSKKGKGRKDVDPFTEKMYEAFKKAHKYTDMVLSWGKDEHSKVRWSGTSTLACMLLSKNAPPKESPEQIFGQDVIADCEKNDQRGETDADGGLVKKDEKENSNLTAQSQDVQELGQLFIANAGLDNSLYSI